ncbi:type III restriction enzyme, res subunit [Leptospira kirschneri str. 200803703]|uniref:DEAD/DEAH box helicase n=1 Tax=Leptospira kirschneri TaxID=29507 RepID=UPI0002C02BAF|nr:type III restriction enzyme, res subunit [Leptospira kirschneri str. 200803703]
MSEMNHPKIATELDHILQSLGIHALTTREKGTYFEELVKAYLKNEPTYKDYYSDVWMYSDWADLQKIDKRDTGIDLVAKTQGTEEYHAIQCKFYSPEHRIQKSDIDSFFTASGKMPFTHRIIVATTNNWSEHAEDALRGQTIPVTKIDLFDLEKSSIDWSRFKPKAKVAFKEKKSLRPHQKTAVEQVVSGLSVDDRGKLIMACGTGKTFTSLKIAERMTGKGKRILFLVPSLSLLSQALSEWTQESEISLHSFAVCSDSEIGKKRKKDDDAVETFAHELQYPATTQPERLAIEMKKRHDDEHMSVVFSTYHSIDVISLAQKNHELEKFDLIICDEAHRTTGATFEGEDESAFVKVHDAKFIKADKRLYMTATPRIYGDIAQAKAQQENITLASMDDESLFGKALHIINFSDAVQRGLLVDYKVIVLAVEEDHINNRLQKLLADEDNQLRMDDAAKIVGCWKALSKLGSKESLSDDTGPMRRAVSFAQVIEYNKGAKTHKVSSKVIASMFQTVVDAYLEQETIENPLRVEVDHVDGSMNATDKESKLQWLKEDTQEYSCRILSNVRCLSEGVDVPALDAVLFLSPRQSQVDVVQSVGRVMRMAPNKKRGYVILPIVIPAGVEPHEALNDNKTYKVVWQVLQALRSHDDRFDAEINKIDLNGPNLSRMEVIAVTNEIQNNNRVSKLGKEGKKSKSNGDSGRGEFGIGTKATTHGSGPENYRLQFEIGVIEKAIYDKVVQKCGNRFHWEEWATDIAKIANTHISRIHAILKDSSNQKEIEAFSAFADELRDDLNDSITNDEVVEMLAQHLITKPVFDALFSNYSFANLNPVSRAMDEILNLLQKHHLEKEADTLTRFYESVKMRADGIENPLARQKIVVELYDKFFSNAFPKMSERLGIVYTPVEAVDFIIHSVNDILKSEFGESLGSKNVHILDPFTGTGTFITRLMQSGLIDLKDLPYKFKHEIHANEIVLLAYYIAAINIEATYHSIVGGEYTPFKGILLTDTFQLYEKDDLISLYMVDNSERRNRLKSLDIRVIIGNPPYSSGQGSTNDNNQNVKYPLLDARIEKTYAINSKATNKNSLYDSYIRAIRWASDRLGEKGVMGFITNAGYIEGSAMDGLRKCLAEEFSSLYIFHLRGNGRTSGERCRREGHPFFAAHGGKGGSLTPIVITLFVKNPESKTKGQIYFHNVGDYLTRKEKLTKISEFSSISGITKVNGWVAIRPDKHNDWINQRDDSFGEFISIGDKKDKDSILIFENYSRGLETNRDIWCYNYSRIKLEQNILKTIHFYNSELEKFHSRITKGPIEREIPVDTTQISWNRSLKRDFESNKILKFNKEGQIISVYRPFAKAWLYYDRQLNAYLNQMPRIFSDGSAENLVICITGLGETKGFTPLITDVVPNLHFVAGSQCFPLYLYDTDENEANAEESLFTSTKTKKSDSKRKRREAITDAGLAHFQEKYPKEKITKEDLFYYIYGLLHSPEYREKYADNLSKELPRIPAVKSASDFRAFEKAGRELAKLHVAYEKVKPYPVKIASTKKLADKDYYVTQMRYAKNGKEKDLSTVIFNEYITIQGIPVEAYEYVVNGKPALDWIIERYCVKTDKDSGIVNDANLWATETEKNPKYILELFQRIITMSLETMKIVKGLPGLGL